MAMSEGQELGASFRRRDIPADLGGKPCGMQQNKKFNYRVT